MEPFSLTMMVSSATVGQTTVTQRLPETCVETRSESDNLHGAIWAVTRVPVMFHSVVSRCQCVCARVRAILCVFMLFSVVVVLHPSFDGYL